jgi:solute carrier family 8 (sodium/calcium exchanger)
MLDGTMKHSAAASINDIPRKRTTSTITGAMFDQLGSSTGGLDEIVPSDQVESQRRQEFIDIWRQLRKQYPNYDMHTLNDMAALEMMNRAPKSRGYFIFNRKLFFIFSYSIFFLAYYRIQATKRLGGGGGNVRKKLLEKLNEPDKFDVQEKPPSTTDLTPHITKIRFEPNHYTVLENAGHVTLHVLRTDGNLRNTVYVDYATEDGTATHGGDYESAEGTLIFYPMETNKQIQVKIIDDDIFEEGEEILFDF